MGLWKQKWVGGRWCDMISVQKRQKKNPKDSNLHFLMNGYVFNSVILTHLEQGYISDKSSLHVTKIWVAGFNVASLKRLKALLLHRETHICR